MSEKIAVASVNENNDASVANGDNENNAGTGNESTFEETYKPPIPIFDDGTKEDIDWNQYSSGNSWMGDIYSDIVAQNYEIMADKMLLTKGIMEVLLISLMENKFGGELLWPI